MRLGRQSPGLQAGVALREPRTLWVWERTWSNGQRAARVSGGEWSAWNDRGQYIGGCYNMSSAEAARRAADATLEAHVMHRRGKV